MASYTSRPKQFSNYVPQVDTEEYSKLLAQKDQEYKQGVQKVENVKSSIAQLPVANEAGRQYIQGISDKITSELNDNVGTDWSNQSLVANVTNHANTMSNDPTVNTIVSNAAHIRGQFSNMETDSKTSKGSNIANKSIFMDDYNKFANSTDPNESFGSKYSQYFDKQKYTDDYFAKKHPNQEVRYEQAGFTADGKPLSEAKIYQWDAVKHTWEGLRHDEIAKEMGELLETSPELSNQLSIDAKYKGKSYNALTYGSAVRDHQLTQVERNEKLYNSYIQDLSKYKQGDDEYIKIQSKLDDLTTDTKKRMEYLSSGLREDMYKYQLDEDFRNNANFGLYKDKWVAAQADLYSWGKKNTELIGDSPRKAWYEHQKLLQENRKDTDAEKKENFHEKMEDLKFKELKRLDNAKIAKLTGAVGGKDNSTPLSLADLKIDPNQIPLSILEKTEQKLVGIDSDLEHTKYKYMHDVLGDKSNSMFEKDSNGNYIPTRDSKAIVDQYYNDLRFAYENGGKNKDGQQIIDEADKDHFNGIAEKLVDRDLTYQNLKRADNKWDLESKNNPLIRETETRLNSLRPIQIGNGEILTSDDIRKYAELKGKADEISNNAAIDQATASKNESDFWKAHGITHEQINAIYANNQLSKLADNLTQYPIKKSEFLNKEISGGLDAGIIYNNQQSVGLFGKDPKQNNVIKRNIMQIAASRGVKYDILAENPDKFTISYTQDPETKKYSVLVEDQSSKKQLDPIPLTDNEVNNLKLQDIVTPDPELQRISNNWTAGKNTGDPSQGGMNFKTSFHDDIIVKDDNINGGNPTKIRHGVEYKSTGWYVVLFGKDIKTGKESRILQLPGQPTWEDAKSKLRSLINRYQGKDEETLQMDSKNQRYSTDPALEESTENIETE